MGAGTWRRAGALPLLLAAVALLAGCSHTDSAKSALASKAAPLPVQVSVAPAKLGRIQDVAQVTGALVAEEDVVVGAKAAGKLVAVYKREGDPVKAGEIVADQDTTDLRLQADQQRANLLSAESRLSQARIALRDARTNLSLTRVQTATATRQAQEALQSARQEASVVEQGARPQEIQQAQQTVAAAKADRDKARKDLERYRALFSQNAVSAEDLDQAQATADSADARYNSAVQALDLLQAGNRPQDVRRAQIAVEQANQAVQAAQANEQQVALREADVRNAEQGISAARAGVDQAQAALTLANQAIADASIRSPIDGVVAERRAEPGQQLPAGGAVLRIVSLKSIYFDAQLPQDQFSEVRIGQTVTVSVSGLPGTVFQGSVYRLFPVASSGARAFTVRVRLQHSTGALRPDMFATGSIVLATHAHALLVPRQALLEWADRTARLFVVSGGVAHERHVTTGIATSSQVEILSGLQPGERVVSNGQAELTDGSPVQVLSQ